MSRPYPMPPEYDVAVVGYGPVGMVTAALLGRAGHSVVVLERYASLYNLPRAAIFDDETMRTFGKLGITDSLLPRIRASRGYQWRNGAGQTLIEHEFAAVGRSGWAEWYGMYQPDLEDALDAVIRGSGCVDVRLGVAVEDYRQDDAGVDVVTTGGTVRAGWVVAADGGGGFSREHLGTRVTDHGFSEPWLVCDFALTADVDLPPAMQVCDPAQPVSVISIGPAHHRFSFMLDAGADVAAERDPERVWTRVARWLHPGQAELVRAATYTFRSLVADRWRHGRVLLAGDAAHQMPPFLGQGMCSGIRDAHNLAWKLGLVLGGRAAPDLLDTYQSEREPQVTAVVLKGIELGRVQTMRDPRAAAERDRRLLADRAAHRAPQRMRFPGIGPGLVSRGPGSAAGELFVQGRVRSDGRCDLFDAVLGYGALLITAPGAPSLPAPVRAVAEELLDGVVELAAAGDGERPVDVDTTYAAWFADHGAVAALVRPDFHVFGTASGAGSVDALLAEYAEAVAGAPGLRSTGA